MISSDIIGLVVAALGGAAVGLERQWSGHAEGPAARFAGIRTFTLLGALAGLSGVLWSSGEGVLAGILLAGGVGITVAGYFAASRNDVDGTTEVAALIVLGAGVLAGLGRMQAASGIYAVTILLLVEKSRLHSMVRRIDDIELRAAVRFAVMALVILPLLPKGPYGPYQSVRPRELWVLVLFFSGLSFVAHLLRRVAGPGQGYLLSGILGGLISSTNVTFTFARLSRTEPHLERALAFGAVGANAMLYPRVLLATAVLNIALVPKLAAYLAAPAVVAAVVAAAGVKKRLRQEEAGASVASRNPLQLSAALQMALLFQVVILVVNVVRNTWGQAGILTTAAVLGLTDVDALTLSMARDVAKTSVATAALGIAVGALSNTVLKMMAALFFGTQKFRVMVAGTLLVMAAAAGASIALLM